MIAITILIEEVKPGVVCVDRQFRLGKVRTEAEETTATTLVKLIDESDKLVFGQGATVAAEGEQDIETLKQYYRLGGK